MMSKIYDTLGRKYKEKGNEGMQDFGVCIILFYYLVIKCTISFALRNSLIFFKEKKAFLPDRNKRISQSQVEPTLREKPPCQSKRM